jgi:hypothetical protein
MPDLIVRHANYGLDLIDELTEAPLIGPSNVTFEFVSTVPTLEPTVFMVDRSRWVFEDLTEDVVFSITAQFYLSREVQTGVGPFPAVPDSAQSGVLAPVRLTPRTGYPFPPTLTRAIGSVRLASDNRPIPNAEVVITPIHAGLPEPTPLPPTYTTEDGQYVMWFQPGDFDPPWATEFSATASATVEITPGVFTPVSGSIGPQPLRQQTINNVADAILLAP